MAKITRTETNTDKKKSSGEKKLKSNFTERRKSIRITSKTYNKTRNTKKEIQLGDDGMLLYPTKRKSTGLKSNSLVSVAFSSMQGWRPEMEDTHNIILDGDKKLNNIMFFAVFDGHAGKEVSRMLKKEC